MSTRPSRSVVGSANRAFIDLAHTSRAFVVDATIARAITRFAMIERTSDTTTTDARVVELEALLATERASFTQRIAALEAERDKLLRSYERVRYELELLKRRIFVAKAERVDTQQLELEFAAKMRELEIAAGTLGLSAKDDDGETTAPKSKPKPPGRRSLRDTALRVETIRLADPHFEELVAEGKATVHGVEETCRVAHKRGGPFVLVTQRVKYKTEATDGSTAVVTTPTPPELISRCIAAPSILAHSIIDKVGFGLPLFRQEQRFAAEGLPIDRGSLSRWHEQLGATFGASVVHAMRDHAMRTAFCIATDATGIAVQPIRTHEKQRKACKRGHYLVQIADRDYVFFEYLERETSAAIGELFRGFGGYVQADAKSVFDALFEPPDRRDDGDENLRHEVGCWSHARRKYWEATAAKSEVAREGLRRIGRIFELDARWRGKPPTEIKKLRDAHLRPHVDAFFAWAAVEHDKVRAERGLLASALGYSVRQRQRPTQARQQSIRARPPCCRCRPQELALHRQRRPRAEHRASLHDGRHRTTARPRRRAVPARSDLRPAVLAARALPRTRAALLARNPRTPRRRAARQRDAPAHRPAADHDGRDRAADVALTSSESRS